MEQLVLSKKFNVNESEILEQTNNCIGTYYARKKQATTTLLMKGASHFFVNDALSPNVLFSHQAQVSISITRRTS